MGAQQSIDKWYTISYCKFEEPNTDGVKVKNTINLVSLLTTIQGCSVHDAIHYKLKNEGYSYKHRPKFIKDTQTPLNIKIEEYIKRAYGDIAIKPVCYMPSLRGIHALLTQGNILVAGMILDREFLELLGVKRSINADTIYSDIFLIVGYSQTELICVNDCGLLNIPNSFVSNIKEIWNFEIKSPCQ